MLCRRSLSANRALDLNLANYCTELQNVGVAVAGLQLDISLYEKVQQQLLSKHSPSLLLQKSLCFLCVCQKSFFFSSLYLTSSKSGATQKQEQKHHCETLQRANCLRHCDSKNVTTITTLDLSLTVVENEGPLYMLHPCFLLQTVGSFTKNL